MTGEMARIGCRSKAIRASCGWGHTRTQRMAAAKQALASHGITAQAIRVK